MTKALDAEEDEEEEDDEEEADDSKGAEAEEDEADDDLDAEAEKEEPADVVSVLESSLFAFFFFDVGSSPLLFLSSRCSAVRFFPFDLPVAPLSVSIFLLLVFSSFVVAAGARSLSDVRRGVVAVDADSTEEEDADEEEEEEKDAAAVTEEESVVEEGAGSPVLLLFFWL